MAAYIAGAAITLFAIGLFLYFRHKEKTVGRPGQEAAPPSRLLRPRRDKSAGLLTR